MVLIVNTTDNTALTARLNKELIRKNTDHEIVEAANMKISPCVGCNSCWLKTPGVCAIKDDYETIIKKIISADQLWVITNTAFGFMDHKGKNVFDRIVPTLTMYLKFQGDQMRHVPRYDKTTDVGIIYQGEADDEYFAKWNERCAMNLWGKPLGVFRAENIKEAALCM